MAAFIRAELSLVVWSDDVATLITEVTDLDRK
jgi:hypothetical protein